NGTTAVSHTSGAMVVLGGNQLTINGSYAIYRDFEIRNSDPVRQQTPLNSQNAPHLRGEGIFNLGPQNQFINLIIHDCQEGYFSGTPGVGGLVYGCLMYNNGYVAGTGYNGHGTYILHSDPINTKYLKENIIFNNCSMGVKDDSQNGDAVNLWHEGIVSFNNGSWPQDGTRHPNLLAASNNGFADKITVKDSFFFHPDAQNGNSLRLGLGGALNGSVSITGNYIGGGGQATQLELWSNLTFTGNTIAAGTAPGGNDQVTFYIPMSGASEIWNNNTYYNNTTGTRGY